MVLAQALGVLTGGLSATVIGTSHARGALLVLVALSTALEAHVGREARFLVLGTFPSMSDDMAPRAGGSLCDVTPARVSHRLEIRRALPLRLSAQLRERTRQAHRKVERSFALDLRLVDREAYGALLTTLRSFYAPAEDALCALTGWDRLTPAIDIESRRRAALLDEDLGRLGVVAAAAELGGAPAPAREPRELDRLAGGLGCLYVLEGSALGGRIVARRARAALGEQLPVAFFSGAGRADPGAAWHSLQASIDAFGALYGDAAGRRAVAVARQTFASLGTLLDLEAVR